MCLGSCRRGRLVSILRSLQRFAFPSGSTTLQSFVSSEGIFAPAAAGDEAADRHNHLLYVATKRQT